MTLFRRTDRSARGKADTAPAFAFGVAGPLARPNLTSATAQQLTTPPTERPVPMLSYMAG